MLDSIASEGEPRDEPESYLTLGHLCSAVVHQLINTFSAIVSQAEVLKARAESGSLLQGEIATRADAVVRAALDGSVLARGLAEFSRGATTLGDEEVVDLNRLVAERIDHHRRRPGPRTEWHVDLAPSAELPGKEAHLRLMLDQLLDNAREALPPEGGAISVSTAVDPAGWLVLEVRDDGEGMPVEVQQRALEPFFSTKPGRSGLGLALARGVWRRHRGAFSIENAPEGGTLIRLSRPPEPRGRPVEPGVVDGPT